METSRIFSEGPEGTAVPSESTHLPQGHKLPSNSHSTEIAFSPHLTATIWSMKTPREIALRCVLPIIGSEHHSCTTAASHCFLLASLPEEPRKDEHCPSVSSLNYLFPLLHYVTISIQHYQLFMKVKNKYSFSRYHRSMFCLFLAPPPSQAARPSPSYRNTTKKWKGTHAEPESSTNREQGTNEDYTGQESVYHDLPTCRRSQVGERLGDPI